MTYPNLPPVVRGFDYPLAIELTIDGTQTGAGWQVDADLYVMDRNGIGAKLHDGLATWADQAAGIAKLLIPRAVTAAIPAEVTRVATRPALVSPAGERIPLDLIVLELEAGANEA